MSSNKIETIQVVAAVLKDELGRVLINQRPVGKPWAGYWEFPGGKIEARETPLAALKRELHEELGVTVHAAHPLIHLIHDYPEYHVELHVWRVQRYSGELHAREHQALAWVKPNELSGWKLLPADAPIVTAIRLPPQMLVTPPPESDTARFLETLARSLEQGIDCVQLRAPELTLPDYTSLAREVIALCRRHAARILLNTQPQLARELNADGVHLNSARLMQEATRPLPKDFLAGASCHDENGIHRAQKCGLDYIILGPVQTTPSHPHATILGWDGFARLTALSVVPVYAIGGMQPGQLDKVRSLGGHGIAAMRGLWNAYPPASS
ncbi:MAG: Nudix family hydrolase [Gammaproteobacteria bacterium]